MKFIFLISIFMTTTIFPDDVLELKSKPTINWDLVSKKIVYFTNVERLKNGLLLLRYDPVLTKAAEIHSEFMAKNKILTHVESVLIYPPDRVMEACKNQNQNCMKSFVAPNTGYRVDFICCAENVLFNSAKIYPESNIALDHVEDWMNSPGHRKNILNSSYNAIGAFATDIGKEIIYSTQVFSPYFKGGISGSDYSFFADLLDPNSLHIRLEKKESLKEFSVRAVLANDPDIIYPATNIDSVGFKVKLTEPEEKIYIRLELVDPVHSGVYYPLCQFNVFYKKKGEENEITWEWKKWN